MSTNPVVLTKFAAFEPLHLNIASEDFDGLEVEILILDIDTIEKMSHFKNLALARMANRIQKIVLVATHTQGSFSTFIYNSLSPDMVSMIEALTEDDLFQLSSQIQQAAQNNVYLNLSHELNVEYEKIKHELEDKLNIKAKNLVESRQKIF